MIKRMAVCILTMTLALGICACRPAFGEPKQFDSLAELKSELGSSFLYPEALPERFLYDAKQFTGLYYNDTGTWEYIISYENSTLESDEARKALPPGKFEIRSVAVRCYEPEHKSPEDRAGQMISSEMRIMEFEVNLGSGSYGNLLDIEDVEAIYRSAWSGDGTGDVPYMYTHPSAEFMSGGILYDISIAIFANAADDYEELEEYSRETARFMVRSML